MAKGDDLADLLTSGRTRTTTQRMIEALLEKAGQPNPSLGGALSHGAAMGIMGLIQNWEEGQNRDATNKAMDADIASINPRVPGTPYAPPATPTNPIPNPTGRTSDAGSTIPKDALVAGLMQDKPSELSGGFLPTGGIDRSKIAADLQSDPKRFAWMLNGEVPPGGDRMMQAELTANRLLARDGRTNVATDLQPAKGNPQGYFDSRTFQPRFAPNEQQVADVKNNILPALLRGSDTATEKLGFTPTGNASGDYALGREKAGIYANSAWPSGTPGKGEMMVREAADKNFQFPRLPALGSMLGPTVPPPANLATPQPQQTAQAPGIMQPPVQAPQAGGFSPGFQPPDNSRFMPNPVPTPPTRQASPVPLPPPSPQTIPLQQSEQLTQAIEQYQSMPSRTQAEVDAKGVQHRRIMRMQEEERAATTALQKQNYEMREKAKVEDDYAQQRESRQAAEAQRLKQTPSADDLQKQRDKVIGRATVSETAKTAANAILKLTQAGGMTDPDAGIATNIGASINASPYFGQPIGSALGTSVQSVRNEYQQTLPAFTNAIKQAAGLGAKEMDSNVELQNQLKQIGSATGDKWSNLKAVYEIDKKYGNGELMKLLPPQVVERLEKGAAGAPQQGGNIDDILRKYR